MFEMVQQLMRSVDEELLEAAIKKAEMEEEWKQIVEKHHISEKSRQRRYEDK